MYFENINNNTFFILGVPITESSVTQKFKDFINSDEETIMITSTPKWTDSETQEYKSASVGFNMILNSGYKFITYENLDISSLNDYKKIIITLDNIWIDSNKNRTNPSIVGKITLDLMNSISSFHKNKRIVKLSPGSPYLYNGVGLYLLKYCPLIDVINSKSSLQLCYEELCKQKSIKHLPMNIVDTYFTNDGFKPKSINLIGCIGYAYKNSELLNKLISNIENDDLLYSIQLGKTNIVEKITIEDLSKLYIKTDDYKPTTLAIVKP